MGGGDLMNYKWSW